MKRIFFIFLFFSCSVKADNIATCVLDRMPNSLNDSATYAIIQVCRQKYPGGYESVTQGEGRGWFGYDSGADCAAKEAAGTPNQRAGMLIRRACNCLYDPPAPGSQSCADQFNRR